MPGSVGVVQMPRHVGKQMVPRDVILVAVAVEHAVDARQRRERADDVERRVDDDPSRPALDQQRVAMRVLPAALAAEHGHAADTSVRNRVAHDDRSSTFERMRRPGNTPSTLATLARTTYSGPTAREALDPTRRDTYDPARGHDLHRRQGHTDRGPRPTRGRPLHRRLG